MFRASFCPSSGALYRMLLHMVFSTWCAGWCLGETACIYLVSHQCYMLSMLRSYSCDEPVFWGAFAKLRNTPLSFVMSACLSVCISSASAEGEISYWWLLWKFVEKTQTWLKSVQNIRPCTWRPKRFFFTSLAATCVAQRRTEHTVDLVWKQFQYLLYCWQADTISNIKTRRSVAFPCWR